MTTKITMAAALMGAFVSTASANEFLLTETKKPLSLPDGSLDMPVPSTSFRSNGSINQATAMPESAQILPDTSPSARLAPEPKPLSVAELLTIKPQQGEVIEGTPLTLSIIRDPSISDPYKATKLVLEDDLTHTICVQQFSAALDTTKDAAAFTCFDAASVPVPDIAGAAKVTFRKPEDVTVYDHAGSASKTEIIMPGMGSLKGYLGLQVAYAWDVEKSTLCATVAQDYPQAQVSNMGCVPLDGGQYVGRFVLSGRKAEPQQSMMPGTPLPPSSF